MIISGEASTRHGFFVDLRMNKEIQTIISSLEEVLSGEPWYGRSVYALLKQINPSMAYMMPGNNTHSPVDLIYHMLTWTQFTLAAVEEKPDHEVQGFEDLDWRHINTSEHSWEKGIKEFRETNELLATLLKTKEDTFLNKIVPARKYNYRYLLNGLIQHHIYHTGQIAYCAKQFV